jgi:predicted nucleotide-binding protein (sugar kinase/HSP70/actin superfamily)
MKAAFPHMRNLDISMGSLIGNLGAEVILPPKPTRRSIELGSRFSPEFVCFPFKANLGDLIGALERGADTLISVFGSWSCRFGYYGRLHHQILRDMGYEFDSILIGKESWKKLYNIVIGLNGGRRSEAIRRIWYAFRIGWRKSGLVELSEDLARRVRPYETSKGSTTRVLSDCLKWVEKMETLSELSRVEAEILDAFNSIERDESRDPLRLFIVGETYVVLEPVVNFDIERRVGEMGIYVEPFFTVHKFLIHPFHLGLKGEYGELAARREAVPYLPYPLGGKDQHSIGFTIFASKRGFDGVVHLQPFTCMPETIAHQILLRVSEEYKIPILSLSIDEHSAEAGVLTRLEAFVDLLGRRRKRKVRNPVSG